MNTDLLVLIVLLTLGLGKSILGLMERNSDDLFCGIFFLGATLLVIVLFIVFHVPIA